MKDLTIVLFSKERDMELLKELRLALIEKGFIDDSDWNNEKESGKNYDSVTLWDFDGGTISLFNKACVVGSCQIIPVSRNDFQTMFLLY